MTPYASAPQLLSPAEAARRLSISIRTMRTLIASRALPVVRVTPMRLAITEADLAAYIVARREERT